MAGRNSDSQSQTSPLESGDSPRPRQAACLVCRRSKIKCDWKPHQERCRRCIQLDCECVRPAYHPGRQKGIKNKRTGLDKALYQIDQAVKRARSASQKNPEDDRILNHLQELLSNANTPEHATTRGYSVSGDGDEDAYSEEEEEQDPVAMPDFIQRTQQSLAIDDAENPLQLLARASYIQPSPESRHGNSPQQAHTASTQGQTEDEIQAFFAPAQVHLDVGHDVDPVSLGLVSEEEADKLFNFDGSLIAQSIQGSIERFFDQWYTEWGVSIGKGPDRRLPPYVEILVTHTRLSIYGGVINHPTAPLEVRRFFHTAGLSSALNVMRAAIQGESQLQSMPNNTAIMISFAACFALTLSSYATGGSALAPSVRNLIDETATVLERIGKVTRHRNGLSIKYGKYLKQIVRRAATGDGISDPRMPIVNEAPITTPTFLDQQALWPEPLQFSAMSDDQIVQALNQPGNDFEPSFGGLSWEDMTNFEWLYWPEVGI
ncbi:hypothetical protein HZS61_014569 [Fusarium oxysporum f. sp. conglutinans]|uniref:Zn(2)-C6 fungal-type domain-containing protein n=1 Tax=Fusarium oxysporum f. sp. conglutinans TaxID=100902 RepID=A0A8H6GSW4_FUSOX|nr:hypothetical protein HZS61_014569 [Fusarium oxysporum f. sp. conglutinans]